MADGLKRAYLSLGSNVGDRMAQIRQALALMPTEGIHVRRVSSLYKTAPVDFRSQPWFVNCAAEVATALMPLQLLRATQSIERALGRRPGVTKGPRRIDIDILLYENLVIRSRVLTVPHPRMGQRRFVLIPLLELNAHLRHPVSQRTVSELLQQADASQVRRLAAQAQPEGVKPQGLGWASRQRAAPASMEGPKTLFPGGPDDPGPAL